MLADVFSHPISAVLVMLGLLIFVHELGHYVCGRLLGIGIETFSIGFGPKIFGFSRKGTVYQVALIPLGGYVKFAGTSPTEDLDPTFRGKEFLKAPWWARLLTLLAGPLANVLLAVIVYMFLGLKGIEHTPAVIGQVREPSPAFQAGLKPNDVITAINGKPVRTWREVQETINTSFDKPVKLDLIRETKPLTIELTPEIQDDQDEMDRPIKVGRVGISSGLLESVITIEDKSQAYAAGLRTGMIVSEVHFESYSGAPSQLAIKTWGDLEGALLKALGEGSKTLELHVQEILSYDEQKKRVLAEPKTVILLALHGGIPPLARDDEKAHEPELQQPSLRLHLSDLGIFKSDLTIGLNLAPTDQSLQFKDRLISCEGLPLRDVFGIMDCLEKNQKPLLALDVMRDGTSLHLEVPLTPREVQKPSGRDTVYVLESAFLADFVSPPPFVEVYTNPLTALGYGLKTSANFVGLVFMSYMQLIQGNVPIKALGGPMLIAKIAGDSAKHGLESFSKALAIISINLGVINLFPIPILDGGQILLVLWERIRRKPLSEAALENVQKLGFTFILALVVLSTYNDLSRFWSTILKGVMSAFQ